MNCIFILVDPLCVVEGLLDYEEHECRHDVRCHKHVEIDDGKSKKDRHATFVSWALAMLHALRKWIVFIVGVQVCVVKHKGLIWEDM